MKKLKPQLEQRGFKVEEIKQKSSSPAREPQDFYYDQFPDDAEGAKRLIDTSKQLGVTNVNEQPDTINRTTLARARHFDVKLP